MSEISRNVMVSHGDVTHAMSESETCEDCIRCKEQFEQALKDGTIDRILNQ